MGFTSRKDRHVKLSLSAIVGAGFGLFVALAIALVLGLSVTANYKNTFSLLNDKAILLDRSIDRQLKGHFLSVEKAVVALKPYFDDGTLGPQDHARTVKDLALAMSTNRALTVVVFTAPDGAGTGVYRDENGVLNPFEEQRHAHRDTLYVVPDIKVDSDPTWGALVQNEFGLFVNVSVPVVRDGQLAGVLTAATSLTAVAEQIKSLDEGDDSTIFIVANGDEVILHSDLSRTQTGATLTEQLPVRRSAIGDPVLVALDRGEKLDGFDKAARLGINVSQVEAAGEQFIVMRSSINGFSNEPWVIGQYFRNTSISREVRRLMGSAMVGMGAMVIAVLIAVWLGRKVARPLKNLARQSQRVGGLNLNEVAHLPRSRIAELDQVALAFNAMVEGLKAMNTYVPRSLFIKLMELGGNSAAEAREAELTVLFTDIVGFTALSENMSAPETARKLNEHFAILVAAVEAEGGTVDKFIGDGMLAFWGAPDARPDHAQAAVRAARRIAAALHEANLSAERDGTERYAMRIGIHTGSAVVGNVGALDRWNYTVVGDTVNAAERLQTLGREVPGEPEVVILASADTVRQLPGEREKRAVGQHNLRGRSEQMEVYWLDPFAAEAVSEDDDLSLPVSAA